MRSQLSCELDVVVLLAHSLRQQGDRLRARPRATMQINSSSSADAHSPASRVSMRPATRLRRHARTTCGQIAGRLPRGPRSHRRRCLDHKSRIRRVLPTAPLDPTQIVVRVHHGLQSFDFTDFAYRKEGAKHVVISYLGPLKAYLAAAPKARLKDIVSIHVLYPRVIKPPSA
jgi:hypothetical protein